MNEIHNPYWDTAKQYVTVCTGMWSGPAGSREISWDAPGLGMEGMWGFRRMATNRWSWTIPDPQALAFVQEHARGKIIDPMTGSGYWPYLLRQLGIEVLASDENPPLGGSQANNVYHRHAEQFVAVETCGAVEAVKKLTDPGFTLFLSWPPMDCGAARTLEAYPGDRLIYIGEGNGGCTADEEFFALLERDWDESGSYWPVQYDGLHDMIMVFDRRETAVKPYGEGKAA